MDLISWNVGNSHRKDIIRVQDNFRKQSTEVVLPPSETAVANNGIQIYPNPVSDVLNVTKVSDKATYKIYSAAGQLVDRGNINNGKVNVSALVKGGYVITIDDKGIEQFKSKFIKK